MTWEIRQGDVRDVLAGMDAESVNTCVTSPPYWGLRDYGTGTWDGGDAECDHMKAATGGNEKHGANKGNNAEHGTPYRDRCKKCGATRIDKQLGLEETPEQFVENIVEVFREVRRVLRDDGTIWVNLGDSYASNTKTAGRNDTKKMYGKQSQHLANKSEYKTKHGLKTKDLVGIPWRVAFALQADGWYLRSDIIWSKPNPMPESVTDRPTKAHEYIFLLSKKPKYWYDADAVKERGQPGREFDSGVDRNWDGRKDGTVNGKGEAHASGTRSGGNLSRAYAGVDWSKEGRNKRTVWTVATHPYSAAHFATFPPKLIEPCILAGCPEGGTVLDPFSGSGTTGMVALRHQRNYVGIELNPEYVEMSKRRIEDDAPLFNTNEVIA